MKTLVARRLLASVIACTALAGVALTAGYAGANFRRPAPPSAPIIAVIDLESAFTQLTERTDMEAQLKSQRDELQKRLQDLAEEATSKGTEADQLPSGPAKTAKLREARDARIRAEFEGQFSQKKLDESRGELRRELYLKIVDAVQKLSAQNGYALVLASDESAKIPLADPDTVARAISFKRMLHVDKALDITNDVVTTMNNDYSAGVRTPAPAKSGKK